MKNKDIQELKGLLTSLVELRKFFEELDIPELKLLFKKSITHLEKILENQNNNQE
jgi:hypothetical protein